MRRRIRILAFNLGLAFLVATLYTWVLSGRKFGPESVADAFLLSWWAGLLVGGAVGVGATLGSRPVLSHRKCAVAQGIVVATSFVGAWIGSFFAGEIAMAEEAVRGYLEDRGVVIGSWVGAAAGVAFTIVDAYRQRRRADRRKRPR